MTPDPWNGDLNGEGLGLNAAIKNVNCVEADGAGGGTEVAIFKMSPVKPGTNPSLLGCAHVQLTDNGYSMANSWTICNQTTGAEYDDWAGWIYHPYWGTYCSILWIEYPSAGQYVRDEERCRYTNGY